MTRYLIILEETQTGFSAYSPDIPGCVATGSSREEVERAMYDAVVFHIEGLQTFGLEIPKPVSSSSYVEVAA